LCVLPGCPNSTPTTATCLLYLGGVAYGRAVNVSTGRFRTRNSLNARALDFIDVYLLPHLSVLLMPRNMSQCPSLLLLLCSGGLEPSQRGATCTGAEGAALPSMLAWRRTTWLRAGRGSCSTVLAFFFARTLCAPALSQTLRDMLLMGDRGVCAAAGMASPRHGMARACGFSSITLLATVRPCEWKTLAAEADVGAVTTLDLHWRHEGRHSASGGIW